MGQIYCVYCGRKLKNKDSRRRRSGEMCYKKHSPTKKKLINMEENK